MKSFSGIGKIGRVPEALGLFCNTPKSLQHKDLLLSLERRVSPLLSGTCFDSGPYSGTTLLNALVVRGVEVSPSNLEPFVSPQFRSAEIFVKKLSEKHVIIQEGI